MANRIHSRTVINAISIENTAIGEFLTGDDGAKFRKFPADAQAVSLPTRTKVQDQMVGTGNAYDQQGEPYYYDALNKAYSGALNSTIGARIVRMWLGGALTETVNAMPGTSDWAIAQLSPGQEPMVCNQIRSNTAGGAKFFYGDVFVQTFEISQSKSSEPRLTAQWSNGGYIIEIPNAFDVGDIESQDDYLKFDGKKTTVTFSDGTTSYDFAGEKRLIDVTISGNQNVMADQLPGDSPVDAAAECEGGYTENLNIDVQEANMRVKVYMDSDFDEFAAWKANKLLTSVKVVFKSCKTIGLTTHKFEIELKFPIGEFNLESDLQDNKDSFTFNIKAIKGDPSTGNLVVGRIRMVGDLDEEL